MPGGDRTGPMGAGLMTGRRAGYCAGYDVPGYASPGFGRGLGLGWGRGRAWSGGGRGGGWRYGYRAGGPWGWAPFGPAPDWGAMPAWGAGPAWMYGPYAGPPTPDQESQFLKAQAESLQAQLDAINQRIEELGSEE